MKTKNITKKTLLGTRQHLWVFLFISLFFHPIFLFANTAKKNTAGAVSVTVSKATIVEKKVTKKKLSKKILVKQKKDSKTSPQAKRVVNSGDYISKEEILGKDYYKPFDSKKVYTVINPLIDKIANLCQYKTLEERVVQFKKAIKQLRKSIPIFLEKHNLQSNDHIFLLSIQSYVVKIFFPIDKKILKKIKTQQVLLAKRFLYSYQSAYNLETEGGPYFNHTWAKRIYTGLKCIEKSTLNDDNITKELVKILPQNI